MNVKFIQHNGTRKVAYIRNINLSFFKQYKCPVCGSYYLDTTTTCNVVGSAVRHNASSFMFYNPLPEGSCYVAGGGECEEA